MLWCWIWRYVYVLWGVGLRGYCDCAATYIRAKRTGVFLKRTVESSYVQYRWPTWVTVNRSFLQLLASFGRVLRGAGTLPQIARVNNLSLGSHAPFLLAHAESSSAMLFSSYSSWQLLRVYYLGVPQAVNLAKDARANQQPRDGARVAGVSDKPNLQARVSRRKRVRL
jgi:hypothetical protein